MRLDATTATAPVWFAAFDAVASVRDRARRFWNALHPGHAVLVGVAVAPLAFGLASASVYWPALGLPQHHPSLGIDAYSVLAAWLAFFVAIAVMVRRDLPLALAVVLTGGVLFYRGGMIGPRHVCMFAVGAAFVHWIRAWPPTLHPIAGRVLAGLGVVQAAYMLGQAWGYDPLWFRFDGGTKGQVQLLGTIGTVDGAAAIVAVTTPLMAPWLMPLGAGAVLLSKSGGAMLALILALAVRLRHRVPALRLALYSTGLLASMLWWASHNAHTLPFNKVAQSIYGRLAIAEIGVRAWWGSTTSPLVGWGLGGWDLVVPQVQQRLGVSPTLEFWREAHNDVLQFVIEAGVLGGLLLAWWLWSHRAMWGTRWAPSLVALAVVSVTFFPWHVTSSAFVGLILIGCATSPQGVSA